MATFSLGEGDNRFLDRNAADTVFGEGGGDTIDGGLGGDDLYGGAGRDVLAIRSILDGVPSRAYGGAGDDAVTINRGVAGCVADGGEGFDTLSLRVFGPGRTRLSIAEDGFLRVDGAQSTQVLGFEALVFAGGDRGDSVRGGDGADTLDGGGGKDRLKGGGGDDWFLVGPRGQAVIAGGRGDDRFLASFFADQPVLFRLGIDSQLSLGRSVVDLRSIEALNLSTGKGDDSLGGGRLGDLLSGRDGDDWLDGGQGEDSLYSGTGSDTLHGGGGNDLIEGNAFREKDMTAKELYGGGGDDRMLSGLLADRIRGDGGNDTILAEGDDDVDGGRGNDHISGYRFGGAATLDGGAGDDVVAVRLGGAVGVALGGLGDDRLDLTLSVGARLQAGRQGGDYVVTLDGTVALTASGFEAVSVTGGSQSDDIAGTDGNDTLAGASTFGRTTDADTLSGRGGDDQLSGLLGRDSLRGGGGDDRLVGGRGVDFLWGGKGADVFAVVAARTDGGAGASRDLIFDFVQGVDVIDLSALDPAGAADTFAFIGDGGFTAAGQVRAEVIDGWTRVTGDLDGDGTADLRLDLRGAFTLTDADFAL
jgi:Ca2+-binding RTX toxin-like protein